MSLFPFSPATILNKKAPSSYVLKTLEDGQEIHKITLTLPQKIPVSQLSHFVYKNAGSAFISVAGVLNNNNSVVVLLRDTQQFSFEQYERKETNKLNKIKVVKIRPQLLSSYATMEIDTLIITLRGFYDIEEVHTVGLYWFEVYKLS